MVRCRDIPRRLQDDKNVLEGSGHVVGKVMNDLAKAPSRTTRHLPQNLEGEELCIKIYNRYSVSYF